MCHLQSLLWTTNLDGKCKACYLYMAFCMIKMREKSPYPFHANLNPTLGTPYAKRLIQSDAIQSESEKETQSLLISIPAQLACQFSCYFMVLDIGSGIRIKDSPFMWKNNEIICDTFLLLSLASSLCLYLRQ